jgi:alkylated DNA repair dioxygenase AlkB
MATPVSNDKRTYRLVFVDPRSLETIPVAYATDEGEPLIREKQAYLSEEEADTLFDELMEYRDVAEKATGIIAGKRWVSERKTLQVKDPNARVYRFTGSSSESISFSAIPFLNELRYRVSEDTGTFYNFALVNFYPSDAKLGFHSDSEIDMVPRATVASISLGDTRRFRFRRISKYPGGADYVIEFQLGHGTLVTMQGRCQELLEHEIRPSTKKEIAEAKRGMRINITFRDMKEQ